MKCRLFYKADGTISVLHSASKARLKGETDKKFLERVAQKAVAGTELEGLPYDDVDPNTLPDRAKREKWRGAKGQGVHIDESVVTKTEKRQVLVDEIDAELGKEVSNPVKILKLQRKLDKQDF